MRLRTGLYVLVTAVLAFESAVFALIFFPRVSDAYRAYFVERSTDCYPLPISGRYHMGGTINFVAGGPSAQATAVKVCGWTDPADTGTWSVGREARLRFRLGFVPADVLVGINMLPFVAGTLQEQRVVVVANGIEIESIRLGGSSTGLKVFRVPRRLILDHWGYLDFGFRFPDAASPVALGINNDRRLLAIRLLSMRLWLARAGAAEAQD